MRAQGFGLIKCFSKAPRGACGVLQELNDETEIPKIGKLARAGENGAADKCSDTHKGLVTGKWAKVNQITSCATIFNPAFMSHL